MPWHVATLIRRNTLCPYNFIFFGRGLIYHAHSKSVIARSSTLLWLDDVAISFRKIFLKKKMKFSRRKGHSSECSVLIVKSKLLQDYFLVLSNEDHKDNHFLIPQRLVLRAYWRLL
jgi:hypothetical protein